MKFLIVDDSQAMQTIIRRSLERAGYQDNEFQMAGDGLEAL
jgi:CheY-like chemotaxis protein